MLRLVVCAVTAMAVLEACGRRDDPPLPSACTAGPAQIATALRAAPGRVTLPGATALSLSTCIERARGDAEIQAVGAVYTQVADDLAPRVKTSDQAAIRLGYLIGATRRAARRTNGISAELARRLEQTVGLDGPPPQHRAAFQRGLAAGARTG